MSKLMKSALLTIAIFRDCALEPLDIGVNNIGELPENFVAQSMSFHTQEVLVGGASLKFGDASDDDGYSTDILAGQAADKIVRGQGALLYDATDKHFNERVIVPANIAIKATVATSKITAGKLVVYVQGYQAY